MSDQANSMFARLAQAPAGVRSTAAVPQYVALFLAVVSVVLLTNVLFEIAFSYQEHKAR